METYNVIPAYPGFLVACMIDGEETLLRRDPVIAWHIDPLNIAGIPTPITPAGPWTLNGDQPFVLINPSERPSDRELIARLKHLDSITAEKSPATQD